MAGLRNNKYLKIFQCWFVKWFFSDSLRKTIRQRRFHPELQKCWLGKPSLPAPAFEKTYFDKGVKDKKIKTEAFNKSLDADIEDRLGLEHYLDFIQYKLSLQKAHKIRHAHTMHIWTTFFPAH